LPFLLLLASCGDSGTPDPAPPNAQSAAAEKAETAPAAKPEPLPDTVRVRLDTEEGPILLALDAKRAPITAANFVRYVEEGRFDGTTFYRAARTKGAAKGRGFIQGGIKRNYRLMLPPIEHEPTSKTGLKHLEGTISMARKEPGNAMGEFFITANAMPAMDAKGDEPGFAAFGRVTEGMDTVRRILAAPTVANAGRGAMRGEMIEKPVKIVKAERVE
jgi:peptidyl-prolyl cis-trans isomerase A (cyclophilin A)